MTGIRARVVGGQGLRDRVSRLPDVAVADAEAPADCLVTDDPPRTDGSLPTVLVADSLDGADGTVDGFVRPDAADTHLADQLRLAAGRADPGGRSKAERLHDITSEMVARDDPDEVYELAVEAAEHVLNFDVSYIAEAGETHFRPRAFASTIPSAGYDDEMRLDEGIAGRVYQRGESILLDDLAAAAEAKPVTSDYRAALSVPIGDVGIFQAAAAKPGAFDERDRELVELLMSHVGETVSRLRTEARLRERNRTFERLHAVATSMLACESEAELCDRLVAAAEQVLDFEVCVVLTDAGPDDGLEIVAATDSPLAPEEGGTVPSSSGIVGRTYATGESVLVRDLAGADEAAPHDEAYGSAISVPFGSFGVVQAIAAEQEAYDERDRELAELFVSQAGAALARIRAERDLVGERDRLREFASVLSHDLRGPLNVALGHLDLAAGDERRENERSESSGRPSGPGPRGSESPNEGAVSEASREPGDVNEANVAERASGRSGATTREPGDDHLDRVAEALDRMNGLVDDVLELAREPTVEETRRVDLEPLATSAADTVGLGDDRVEVTPHRIAADPDRLLRLLENLLRNAVEHGYEEVAVRVGPLSELPDEASAASGFYVADDGPGIPPGKRETVFDHGYTTSGGGTGLGLAIVETIAEAHGWRVSVTESVDGGARFEIRT